MSNAFNNFLNFHPPTAYPSGHGEGGGVEGGGGWRCGLCLWDKKIV